MLCSSTILLLGTENDSKLSNMGVENHTKEDRADCSEPSECKIPKTEPVEVETPTSSNEVIEVKVVYNKNKYDVSAPANSTIAEFKKQLQGLLGSVIFDYMFCSYTCNILFVGVPDSMQKLMYKGLLQDNQSLSSIGITKGAKIMLVGSTLNDVLAVSSVTKQVNILNHF